MSSLRHKGCSPLIAAGVLASQSRSGNHQLESRVRENRTHGSEGGDGESRSRPPINLRERHPKRQTGDMEI
jgi:hypothetical protein